MSDWLCLMLDAPLMSFGGPLIDQHGVTRPMPGLALMTGLLGNALGYDHRDADQLERLQTRLCFAGASLRAGAPLVDFHTVELGQDFMRSGWTTRGAPQYREGGSAGTGTHIRYRHYLAGALRLIVLTLEPADETPDLDQLAHALERPARPLFLGRKTCLPARPLCFGRVTAETPLAALHAGRASVRDQVGLSNDLGPLDDKETAEWPLPPGTAYAPPGARIDRVVDRRDWRNQILGG